MKVRATAIHDVIVIEPQIYSDSRGIFYESFNRRAYCEAGIGADFVQDNESVSSKGVIRGLHLQRPPMSQGKLVRVVEGEILEVAVDCRLGSSTFGQFVGEQLSGENRCQMWIPKGFASGYAALSERVIFTYKVDNYYSPEHELCLRFNDPAVGIDWLVENPILSQKDSAGLKFSELVKILSEPL
ncbi:MAG: dTDP-4-dehydrorhamnose 3,5-epimerase [Patescibacteria group bacterium]|nr:dTDP-4-dehydrorhamnose 3,5-epimerase [Patescibacteria group bacterium]